MGDIWLPDIEVYNLVSKKALRREGEDQVVLRSDGSINWIPPYLLTTTCKTDHTWFPFDQQKCRIKFGSWSCSSDKIDLQEKDGELDLSGYVMNPGWHLESAEGEKSEISYGPGATYQSMTFTISLKRRGLHLVRPVLNRHNMLLIQSSLLTIVNILSFLIPATHPSPRLLLHLVSLIALSITSNNVPHRLHGLPGKQPFFLAIQVEGGQGERCQGAGFEDRLVDRLCCLLDLSPRLPKLFPCYHCGRNLVQLCVAVNWLTSYYVMFFHHICFNSNELR